jgi:hypothetical protein
MMPQLTRTIRAADEITSMLEGPVKAAAPNIQPLVTTFSSPGFAAIPGQMGEFMNLLAEMSRRLTPLTQFAENAGGLFGGIRVPGMSSRPSGQTTAPTTPSTSRDEAAANTTTPANEPAKDGATAEKTAATKAATKKTTAKKSSAKKSTAKKSRASKSSTKKS